MAEGSKTTVDNTTTEIIAAAERRGFTIYNPSSSIDLWVKLGAAAVVGEGMIVKAGTSLILAYEGEWNTSITRFASYNLAVNGIYASGSEDVAYHTL